MGVYLNPGNQAFADTVCSGMYVDKSGLIQYLNGQIGKPKHLIASSRPRRFGKTMAVQMLTAYYSRGCDSADIFRGMEIEGDESFRQYLNQYDVLCLDIQWMKTSAAPAIQKGKADDVIGYINDEVLEELREAYPDQVGDKTASVAKALANINAKSGVQFVIIIDEWDCFFREEKRNQKLLDEYIDFLRSLFKGNSSDKFVKLAYITGILPIKKYGTQSALNNFRELTMENPGGIARYIGFTESEVRMLSRKHKISFAGMKEWYDGYFFRGVGHVYSPNSVMEAIENREFRNYWSRTETYESLKLYIEMDFDELKQKIVDMLAGGHCKVNTDAFQNDMTTFKSADDVLTLLIHLGYLAYNCRTKEAVIPNEEVRSTFQLSVMDDGWAEVYQALRESEALLQATLEMNSKKVAGMIQDFHMKNATSLVYNNEVSLASVIQIAYYTAAKDYTVVREMPAGEGFADMVFLPKRKSKKPALVIELKWDKTAEGAIRQIKDKRYFEAVKEFRGNILLVGISYDVKSKKHECIIEKDGE